MKVTHSKTKFSPIILNIVLETYQEAEAFYNIFNHAAIIDSADISNNEITENLVDAGYLRAGNSFEVFSNKLKDRFRPFREDKYES